MTNISVIVAFAADHLDREADKATAEDRVDDLSKLSQRVHSGDELFKLWAEAKGGRAIAIGNGDGRIEVGADHLEEISQLKEQYNQEVGSTCSIGVGKKLSEAEKALTYAQRTGGNSIELYTKELGQELASLQEPEGEEKLFNSFFDKAEGDAHKPPSLNRSTVKNAGGGMTGASEPVNTGPDKPDEPGPQEDETSENQAMQGVLDSQPPASDVAGQFGQLAEQSEKKEGEEKQAQAEEAQDSEDQKNLRGAVVEVLKQFKEQAPLWEQLKQAQPDAYKTLTGVIQAMVALARKAFMDEDGEGEEGQDQQPQPVQKAELPLAPAMHSQVEPFLGALKAMPKEGPARGKFITSHMNHGPFLQALQAHPQGRQVYSMLSGFLNSKANAGVGVGAVAMAKALPHGAKLPLKPGGDIGDQTENRQNTNHHAVLGDYVEERGGQAVHPMAVDHKLGVKAKPIWDATNPEHTGGDETQGRIDVARTQGRGNLVIDSNIGENPWASENASMGPGFAFTDRHKAQDARFWAGTDGERGMFAREPILGVPTPDKEAFARSPIFKRKMVKAALEAGKTGRHQVVLPVNSQLDASASADRTRVGRIKILDRNSGKTKWRQTRAGIVQDPMGNPTSSRNPTGGVKPDQVIH